MPLQNRVDPFGNLLRTPARGTMMGNRGGALHNSEREIVRSYKSRRWIACVLEFKGRRRTVMSERRYTELFFLDEAVAFAAGHRPCAECRRERFNAFKEAWRRARGLDNLPFADEMDMELHPARIDSRKKSRMKRRWTHCLMVASWRLTAAHTSSGATHCCSGRRTATRNIVPDRRMPLPRY